MIFFSELSEGSEAAQGERIEFAGWLGHSDQGDNKATGALEGLQSKRGEISDLVSLNHHHLCGWEDYLNFFCYSFLLRYRNCVCFIFGSAVNEFLQSLGFDGVCIVIIILLFKIVNCYTVSAFCGSINVCVN